MSQIVLVAAPHPDDETLGCGGTLLKYRSAGAEIHWLICTEMNWLRDVTAPQIEKRQVEIEEVASLYGVKSVHRLGFPTTKLDALPMADVVRAFSDIMTIVRPTDLFLPYGGDVHSDHRVIFEAGLACSKWFRYPSIRRIFAYEVLSETDQVFDTDRRGFHPNYFVNISDFLDEKLKIARIFESEMGKHPFPRSDQTMRALAEVRGASCGFYAAEAFLLLKSIID